MKRSELDKKSIVRFFLFKFILIPLLSGLCFQRALAKVNLSTLTCLESLQAVELFKEEVHPLPENVRQWLLWETQSNLKQFRNPIYPMLSNFFLIPDSNVIVRDTDSASGAIRDIFVENESVLWPTHPLSTHKDILPYRDGGKYAVEHFPAYLTASRSMVFFLEDQLFSVKAPTNHAHVYSREKDSHWGQPGKFDLRSSVKVSIGTSQHIQSVERSSKQRDDTVVFLYDIFSISETDGFENGFVVRDLSPILKGGKNYLPGFAILYEGRDIAKRNNQDFEAFWEEHYAKVYGKLMAHLLIKYGVFISTPNSQQVLLELDKNSVPTGRIAYRDMGDTYIVPEIVKSSGRYSDLEYEKMKNMGILRPNSYLNLSTRNPFFHFNAEESEFHEREYESEIGVSPEVIDRWQIALQLAFIQEVNKLVGVDVLPEDLARGVDHPADFRKGEVGYQSNFSKPLTSFLLSESSLEAISRFHTLSRK